MRELRVHLEGLRRAKDKKRQELRAVQQELDALSAAISRFEEEPAAIGEEGAEQPPPVLAGKGIVAGATEVLKSGKSLTTRELWDAIHAAGVKSDSANPIATCYATLRNAAKTFERKDNRWRLKCSDLT
jgi:hypothetical protein